MQKRGKLCFCYSMLKSSYFCDLLVSFSTVHFNYHRSTHTSNTNKIKRSLYPLEEKNLILFIPKKIPFKITSRSSQGIVKIFRSGSQHATILREQWKLRLTGRIHVESLVRAPLFAKVIRTTRRLSWTMAVRKSWLSVCPASRTRRMDILATAYGHKFARKQASQRK